MKILNNSTIPAFPKIRGDMKNIHYPCYTEVKLDGEANVYCNNHLISKSSGKVRTELPITNCLSQLVDSTTVLFGELYVEDGKFGALYKFLSMCKNEHALKFTIFDVYHPTLRRATYEDRRDWLYANLPDHKNLIVDTKFCVDSGDVAQNVLDNAKEGYEGLVVKNRDSYLFDSNGKVIETQTGWVKLKHKFTADLELVVLDSQLERGEVKYKGRNVGVKIPNKYKVGLKIGDIVEIEHQGELSGGSLRHPVYVRKREPRKEVNEAN